MRIRYLSERRVPVGVVEWHPAMLYAFIVVDHVYRKHTGRDAVLTGGQEDAHSKNSLHYGVKGDPRCRAADFALDGVNADVKAKIVKELKTRLPDFDVVLEELHIHVEWDMKE